MRAGCQAKRTTFASPSRVRSAEGQHEYTVPVCRLHHRELHRYEDEASCWVRVNVDPLPGAPELRRRSRLSM
jgi:hypothetical protein